jgi:hypothetical protein
MITDRELRARAYELSAGVSRPAEADRLIGDLHRSGELVQLEGGMWTTRSLREREQATVQIAKDRANEKAAPVSEQTLRQARRETAREIGDPITGEQRQALEQITGPGGVSVLIGQAGSGKGVVISAASEAWRKEGYEVIGIAIPGATAKRLGADAKLERSVTTDALINRVEPPSPTNPPNPPSSAPQRSRSRPPPTHRRPAVRPTPSSTLPKTTTATPKTHSKPGPAGS